MILFRADGNSILGMGHIMRCLSIADALKEREINVEFVLAESFMQELIESRGYTAHVLNTDYSKPTEEIAILKKADYYKEAAAILLDSYYVTEEYVQALKGKMTVYVDDYFTKLPVDAIINYSVYADESEYVKVYENNIPKLILGPAYAPLRKEFCDTEPKLISQQVKDVLVLTGGSDSLHVALSFAREVLSREDDGISFHFVVGLMSEDYDEICTLAESNPSRIMVHHNVHDMKGLMSDCDMAISAAGSTQYELCACGIPTINYTLADNQVLGARAFEKQGVMLYAGDVRDSEGFYTNLYDKAKELANSQIKRTMYSEKARNLVDGNGAGRIAVKLEEMI